MNKDIVKPLSDNVFWQKPRIRRHHRCLLNAHGSVILWFTGFSGAGKSTVAHALEERLHGMGCRTYVLDGDNIRHGLCGDLGFSHKDRSENIRRIGEVAKLMIDAGIITLAAFISPYRSDRERVRGMVMHGDFLEIYCKCDIDICESRDVKGIYKKARMGEIHDFTGISAPYEPPFNPELTLDTAAMSVEECVEEVLILLKQRGLLP